MEAGYGLCCALLAFWIAQEKMGMLAAGILLEEKEKLGTCAPMARLLGHYIYTGEKKTRDTSII